jgi:hypothetical protein
VRLLQNLPFLSQYQEDYKTMNALESSMAIREIMGVAEVDIQTDCDPSRTFTKFASTILLTLDVADGDLTPERLSMIEQLFLEAFNSMNILNSAIPALLSSHAGTVFARPRGVGPVELPPAST